MIEFTKLHLKDVSHDIDNNFLKVSGIDPIINIDTLLDSKQKDCKNTLIEKLEDFLIIFDDGIKVVIKIHELCKHNHLNTKNGIAFSVLSSKMVSLLVGIRKMIYSGLVDCIKNLNRPFIEAIDVFFACLINKELCDSFARTDKLYDNNKFYWNNFSKDKLSKEYNKLFRKLSMTEDYIKFLNERRKNLRSFFSESIHASFNSTFSNYMMFTLDLEVSDDYYGKVTTAYPQMLMKLIEDIYILNKVFYISLEQRISKDFENVEIKNIDPLYLHYYNKFEHLYSNNVEHLSEQSELYLNFFANVIDEMKKNKENKKNKQ